MMAAEINFGGIDLTDRALFAKNMSVMIKSGIPIVEALDIAADSTQGKFKQVIMQIANSVASGKSLSDGLEEFPKVFSSLFINSVYAGETSGTLEENLEYVAEQLHKEKELTAKIKGALLYPIVVLVAAVMLGVGVVFFVLPKITPLFEGLGVDLPITTRILIWISHFVEQHSVSLLSGIVIFTGAFVWVTRQKFSHPVTHWVLLRMPVVKSLVCNSNIARFCRTLGTLIKSGLTVSEAVAITAETSSNYYYVEALNDISRRLVSGSTLSSNIIMHGDLFPKIVTRMIRVGEESGRLEETLLYLASFFEEEVDDGAKNLSTAIEPILLIGIGIGVGFLALSIITPIYSITGNISR